ncbi:MAG: HAMP domain-containing protein [Anaerolineae bacterium]|nr:HAMP domain-containing protein [Anaerolineae bacterium]
MQDQPAPSVWKRILNTLVRFVSDIRGKIIVPYLILTFAVAVIGLYVITRLLSSSLDERFNNHLLESGRAVLTGFSRQEIDHLEAARTFSLTEGVIEALREGDKTTLSDHVLPAVTTSGIDVVILVDTEGETQFNALKRDGQVELVEYEFRVSDVWLIERLLQQRSASSSAIRAIGEHPVDHKYYYFTAAPIALEQEFVGVVLVGTALDVLLPNLNAASMAEITVYLNEGQAIASTFSRGMSAEDQVAVLSSLSISSNVYDDVLRSEDQTRIETLTVEGRDYRLSRGPLVVGNDRLAVFDVALPSDFLVDSNAVNRSTYVLVFGLAMGAVILLGYGVAQRITRPLFTLMKTSQAVADGDLKQRTGIERSDEIGTLATAFDQMTERLDERTLALQSSLQVQRETASRMRSILSSIGDGVLLEDAQGNIVPLNQAATVMLEDAASRFLSGPVRDLPMMEQDRSLDTWANNPWLLESRRFQVANRIYTAHSATVGSDHGENLGTVIVLRDVTAEMEAEQLKDAFVAHVSHELRTPLTAIKGYTALLGATAGTALNQTQHNFLDRISRQTDNLVGMINALLDFSEVEAGGRIGLRSELIELPALIQDIYDEWKAEMEEKPLTFILEMEDSLPRVNVDVVRLRWALVNLVRNAHQYTDAGGKITLRLSSTQDDVVFQVIDTGVGIAVEAQKRLFTRFYRVMQSHDDNVRGLGLGLYVAKTIIEAHGGSIHVVSEMGVGSAFTVTLPAARAQEAQLAPTD